MNQCSIKEFGEYGNSIHVKSYINSTEYEVEDGICSIPSSSYVEVVISDFMGEELGSIKLNNSEAIYLAQEILKNITLIND